ncbi:Sensors of blue-light using FAD [Pseudoruegeria aquimaris]|uniref:Sensors of blue-light using FAD n=1 Tax=Pseudoruegeria aquimaris TaxID=393663 RepID=A0A1Y5SYK8_9RHOB|nr:BLUF domain-containing protein [Pseudoruegeria aquimaris]SLN51709.1 Sensors of blue-light using FAD [Pseudoruegeria aquimaris]
MPQEQRASGHHRVPASGGEHFLQYLEGEEPALRRLIARISQDPRHEAVTILSDGRIEVRQLPDWQMGFVDDTRLSLAEMLETSGERLALSGIDPVDLISFVVFNASLLRAASAA